MAYTDEALTQIQQIQTDLNELEERLNTNFSTAAVNAIFKNQFSELQKTLTAQNAANAEKYKSEVLAELTETAAAAAENAAGAAIKDETFLQNLANRVDLSAATSIAITQISTELKSGLKSQISSVLSGSEIQNYITKKKREADGKIIDFQTALNSLLTSANSKIAAITNTDYSAKIEAAIDAKTENFLNANLSTIINSITAQDYTKSAVNSYINANLNMAEITNYAKSNVTSHAISTIDRRIKDFVNQNGKLIVNTFLEDEGARHHLYDKMDAVTENLLTARVNSYFTPAVTASIEEKVRTTTQEIAEETAEEYTILNFRLAVHRVLASNLEKNINLKMKRLIWINKNYQNSLGKRVFVTRD